MKLKGKQLKFISQIRRDGSGTDPLKRGYITFMKDDSFEINCLSLTEGTFIASGFNSFVVRLKKKK